MKKIKLIKYLKKYQVITIYIGIFITTLSLIVSTLNSISNIKTNNITMNEVAPAFNINTYEKNGMVINELVNRKGFVNNLKFSVYDEINISLPESYTVIINCGNAILDKNENNKWYFSSKCGHDVGEKLAQNINDLKDNYNVNIGWVSSETYYELYYQDYTNKIYKDIYYKDFDDFLIFKEPENENDYFYKYSYSTTILYSKKITDEMILSEAEDILENIEIIQNKK